MPSCLIIQAVRQCTNNACTQFTTINAYLAASPQPTEYTACINVLTTPAELSINQWALTTSQGTTIATKIAIVWAIAYVFRMLIHSLKSTDGVTHE